MKHQLHGWQIELGAANRIVDGNGVIIAHLPSHWPASEPAGLLLAAAPELLSACCTALATLNNDAMPAWLVTLLESAIRRAGQDVTTIANV